MPPPPIHGIDRLPRSQLHPSHQWRFQTQTVGNGIVVVGNITDLTGEVELEALLFVETPC